MLNLGTVEGNFLDDGLFTFYVDGRKYVRKVRKNIADQNYIIFNHREFLVQGHSVPNDYSWKKWLRKDQLEKYSCSDEF